MASRTIQYQQKTEAPPGAIATTVPTFESAWHQPWSEPVRFKVAPGKRAALMASGPFAPVLNPDTQIVTFFESRWHQPWSEPKRFRRALHPSRNPFVGSFFDITPNPGNMLQGWYQSFRDPRWPKKGLRAHLQQTAVQPNRYLPVANITATMAATETNSDTASFAITTTGTPTGVAVSVAVSITELPNTDGFVSVVET